MVVHRATDAVPDRWMVLPLVDQHRRRLRERAANVRLHDRELGVVVEVIARNGALACCRGLPDRSSALEGDRDV